MKDLCLATDIGDLIYEENLRQIDKWGVQDHHPFAWLAFTLEELGELSEAMSEHLYREGQIEDVIKEAIQTATLSLKIAEMYRNTMVTPIPEGLEPDVAIKWTGEDDI